MTIEALNTLDRAHFVETVGWAFEHSQWVAERAWTARPFMSVDTLHGAMVNQVERASAEEQLALLKAHPDLGTRPRGSINSRPRNSSAFLRWIRPIAISLDFCSCSR